MDKGIKDAKDASAMELFDALEELEEMKDGNEKEAVRAIIQTHLLCDRFRANLAGAYIQGSSTILQLTDGTAWYIQGFKDLNGLKEAFTDGKETVQSEN